MILTRIASFSESFSCKFLSKENSVLLLHHPQQWISSSQDYQGVTLNG